MSEISKKELYQWEMLRKSRDFIWGDVVLICYSKIEIKLHLEVGEHKWNNGLRVSLTEGQNDKEKILMAVYKDGLHLSDWDRIFILEPAETNPEFRGGRIMFYDSK